MKEFRLFGLFEPKPRKYLMVQVRYREIIIYEESQEVSGLPNNSVNDLVNFHHREALNNYCNSNPGSNLSLDDLDVINYIRE
jgi:hypothetical protein